MILILQVTLEWLELVSLASSFGVLACLLWVLPLSDGPSGRGSLLDKLLRLLGIGIASMIATSTLGLLLRAVEMSGHAILDAVPMLPTVVLRTHVGTVWSIRTVALVFLVVTMAAAWRHRHSRPWQYVALVLAMVVSATESASGHAADAGDFSVAEIIDWLHLLGPMVWGGGLLVLSAVVLPHLGVEGDRAAGSTAGVATRFSRIAGVAVGSVALTAVYQTWSNARSVEALEGSPYGRTIIAKTVLFALLLCLGAFNRCVSVPRLREWAGSVETRRRPLVASRFRWSVNLEACLVLAVLLCSALLRHEVPARHARHLGHGAQGIQMGP